MFIYRSPLLCQSVIGGQVASVHLCTQVSTLQCFFSFYF